MKTLLHVDMDAFFASCELLKHPEWKGKCVIVGSKPGERGVVSTCSYEARAFGVHSAMPSSRAYELCPHGIFVHPDMEFYEEVSRKAFDVFYSYTPYVEPVSCDEAFLDVTGSLDKYDSPSSLAKSLMQDVERSCGVTCSIGVASNRLLAKIGSDENKPRGLTVMPIKDGEIASFLSSKPVGVLWGVGKKTVESLRQYGIRTCGDIQRLGETSPGFISPQLVDFAFGRCDDCVYWQSQEEKSVSREHTFPHDELSRERVREKLLELVAEVGFVFRKSERWAKTCKIKLRSASFNTITRQQTLLTPSRDDMTFRKAALELFERENFAAVRLVGFGVENISRTKHLGNELSLFPDEGDLRREKHERLSQALDGLREQGLI
jgi:nucleotidyltransferase/DNA polymerase involved in DNA repair